MSSLGSARSPARDGFVTAKAIRELKALELGLDRADVRDICECLSAEDFRQRLISKVSGERLYVFSPAIVGTTLYLKLALREDCVVISCHEEPSEQAEDGF